MADMWRNTSHRAISSTASENCYLCAGIIWPGEEVEPLHGMTVHGRCFDRDVAPDLEPTRHPDED